MQLRRGLAVPPALMAALFLVLGTVFLVLGAAGPAAASVGVGIQAAPVRLAGLAHPGQSATVQVFVVNSGSQPESVRIAVQRLSHGQGRPVPASWVKTGAPIARLAPHHAVRVTLELAVPGDAKPGAYLSDVVATGYAPASAGRANLGAAAATLLEFRVADPAAAFWPSVFRQSFWALLIVILLAAVALAIYKSGLRLRVEREPVGYGTAEERGG